MKEKGKKKANIKRGKERVVDSKRKKEYFVPFIGGKGRKKSIQFL